MNIKKNIALVTAVFLLNTFSPQIWAENADGLNVNEKSAKSEEVNTGQDIAKPLTRFDVRLKYQRIAERFDALTTTLRVDKPFMFDNGWQISTRTDLLIPASDVRSADNLGAEWKMGLGDILNQVLVITPTLKEKFALAAGTQVIWPSGTQDQFGSGKYQLLPTVAAVYYPAWLSKGSFLAVVARQQFSLGGDGKRKEIHKTLLQPILNVNLPRHFFVGLAPEGSINWRKENDRFFVPFDLTIGKMLSRKVVTSLEWKQGIVHGDDPYNWELEARAGYFF